MKFKIEECETGFFISMEAETVMDSAMITRMALNASQESVRVSAYVNEFDVKGQIHFNRKKRKRTSIYNNNRIE